MKMAFWMVLGVLGVVTILCFLVNPGAGCACLGVLAVATVAVGVRARRAAVAGGGQPAETQEERKDVDSVYMILRRLSKDYRVFDRVPTVEGLIDHVVVSRQGVAFAISVKTHAGRVKFEGDSLMIDGKPPEKDLLGQCLRNAYWVKDKIREQTGREVVTHPLLVFTHAFVDAHDPVRGVQAISRRNLVRRIEEELPRRDMSSLLDKVRL